MGDPTSQPAVRDVLVPKGIAESSHWTCFAFDTSLSAACQGNSIADDSSLVSAQTSAGLYNPVYYALVGWPTLVVADTSASVMAMRLVSGVLVSLFLTIAFFGMRALIPGRLAALGFGAAMTPMVFFLSGAVNPNGLEVATGASLLCSLLVVVGARPVNGRRWWLVSAAISAVLLTQARGLSPLWMALIGALVIVVTPWERIWREIRRWDVIAALATMLIGVGFALFWVVQTNTLGSMGTFPGAASETPARAFVTMVLRAFDPGLVGVFGWLDTWAPPYAYAFWGFLSFLLVIAAFTLTRGRSMAATVIALAALIFIPAIVQAASIRSSGYIWQGRYGLVAYVILIMLATSVLAPFRERIEMGVHLKPTVLRLTILLGTLVVVGQAWAVTATLQRYQGLKSSLVDTLFHPVWAPPGGTVLWIGLAVVAAALAATTILLISSTRPREQALDADTSAPDVLAREVHVRS